MESLMSARQVAELLGVHENWVYDQAARGDLPSYKIGGARRFDPDELRAWLAGHRQAMDPRVGPGPGTDATREIAGGPASRADSTASRAAAQPRLFDA
jgi:excisionase family DNA binding protein